VPIKFLASSNQEITSFLSKYTKSAF